MASGDSVVQIIDVMPTGTLAATIDTRASASSPAANVLVYDYDDSTAEYLDFKCKLEGYGGGGLTFTLVWSATTATSGNCVWRIAVRRMADDTVDIDTSHTYDYNSVTAGAASASGEVSYDNITFTNGADMDSWAEGEVALVRVGRDAANGSDTMTGDAELWAVFGLET